MYSTCIFCHSSLGSNEVIEHFPIGRRLAFDAARGRLWVVCQKCERWNLTPIEERWEAIEECEEMFSATRLRVSTENIGLARVREGLELVRIGTPLRPEMAAWRYGDQFGRRRKKHLLYTGVGVAAAAGLVILGPATGIIAGSSWGLWNILNSANSVYQQRRIRAKLMLPGYDAPVGIRLRQLKGITILPGPDDWALRMSFEASGTSPVPLSNGRSLRLSRWNRRPEVSTILTGEPALQAAAKLLPAINSHGAKREEVESAVRMIGEVPEPTELFARYAALPASVSRPRFGPGSERGHHIMSLPKEIRLALEMATHEESERRALEGELALLQAEWQQAEEIASIADDMFIPDETRDRLTALKSSTPD
jgi:hypothetical protein